jgi:hypothetical protein
MDQKKLLEEVQVLAQRKYGRPFDALSEEEKKAIYRDYVNEGKMAEADYLTGQEMLATAEPDSRSDGRLVVASNPLEHLGTAALRGVGAYQQRGAREKMDSLSKDYALGSRAAGDVAAHSNGQQMSMMAQMLRGGAPQNAQPPSAPPVQQAPQPTSVPGSAPPPMGGAVPPQMGGGMPGGQLPLRVGQPGGPQANAPMLSGGVPMMPNGQPVPKTREEWQAYLMRSMNGGY